MIYLFSGNNIKKSQKNAHNIVDSLLEKKKEASVFFVDADNFSEEIFDEYIKGRSLFEERHIVYSSILSRNEDSVKYLTKKTKEIKKSPNIFIFIEDGQNKLSKLLEKNSEKTQINEIKKEEKTQDFNIFSITDALGERNRVKLWIFLQKALSLGVGIDEIYPIFLWQVKNILIVIESKTEKESGLKPYPYKKAISFSKNFSKTELYNLFDKLIRIHVEERGGKKELSTSLEKLVLSI